jgi:hypothetical protein
LRQARVDRGQPRERRIQAQRFFIQAQAAFDFLGQLGDAVQVAAALLRQALARVVDDDAAHRRRRIGEEVRAIVELRGVAADEFQVRLVHERGGIERVPVLPGELPARHGVQLLVQGGEHAIERAAISIAGGIQQLGDVGSLGHGPLNGPEYSPDCEARHGVSALHRPRKPEFPC